MARAVTQEEFDRIASTPQAATPKRARAVSQEEFDRIISQNVPPEPPIDRTENIGRGLESGLRGMAQSVIGTLPEAAGQALASTYDALRAPTVFPGMTNEQFTQMKDARAAQVPTQNPMQGWSESTRGLTGTRPQDMAAYAQDPRTTPENAPYYRMGGPGGYIPIPQFGTAQQARLGYEVANMLPQVAPAAVAAVTTGGMGAIPAIVAGVTGGGMEGLQQYEDAIDKGESPQEALRQMSVMGLGSGALNMLPWTRGIKLLPERFQNRVIQGLGTGLLEGATEMGEGGVQQIAETKQLPQTQEEWADAAERIAKGVWDERSVFLAAAITGFGGGVLADPKNVEARQKAQQEAGQLLLEYKQPKQAPPQPEGPPQLGFRGNFNPDGSPILPGAEGRVAPLAQEPINIGPGGATIGPPQSNIGIEPMGEALAPQLPPGAREPELRMPYIPQDVIVPPAGRTVAPEMPVVPSQAQQAAPEPTASREDANRVVDELAAQLGIQPIEEPTPQATAKAKLESRRAARQAETKPKPVAEFAGWQERPRKPPIALYNIPQGTGMTTVSGETATAQGFDLAEPTPAPAAPKSPSIEPDMLPISEDFKVDTISGYMDYDEFERKGYDPSEVTRDEWVALQRANRRKLRQPEESGTRATPYGDYTEYHRASVERALKAGDYVDDRVLADYPDLTPNPAPEYLQSDERTAPEQPAAPEPTPTTQAMPAPPAPPKPTPKERKLAKDRVDKHGLTKEQMDYLTGEIQAKWDTLPRDPKDVDPKSDTRAVIKVPGDGTFIIESQLAANAIHKRLTGKWIDEGSAKEVARLGSEVKWGGFKETPNPQRPIPSDNKKPTPAPFLPDGSDFAAYERAMGEPMSVIAARQSEQEAAFERGEITSPEPEVPTPTPEPAPVEATRPTTIPPAQPRTTAEVPRKVTINKLLSLVPEDVVRYDSKNNQIAFDNSQEGITRVQEAMDKALDSIPKTPTTQAKYEEAYGEIMDSVFSKQQEGTAQTAVEPSAAPQVETTGERRAAKQNQEVEQPVSNPDELSSPAVSEEQYLASKGASRQGIGESALHKNIQEGRAKRQMIDRQAQSDRELIDKRDALRKEYRAKVKSGEIRKPTRQERLERIAQGQPDNEATQAAQRLLGKMAPAGQPLAPPSPQVETTGERLEALQSNRDNMTPEQYSAERDSIMAEKRESAKAQKKKGESGFINLSVPMDAARSVGKFIKEGRRVEFKHGLRESKPLSVELRGEINRATKEAEQAVADVTNAYRDSISTNALQRSTVNAFKEVPEDVRIQINDYLAEPDRVEKAKRLQALPEPMRAPVRRLREIVDTLSARLADSGVVSQGKAEIIRGNLGHYLHRSYKIFKTPEAWRKEVPELYKENMRNFLRKEHPTDSEAIINERLQEWLNVSMDNEGNVLFPSKKLGTMDKTSLEQRKQFPKEVLDLWGVERDGILNFLETVKASAEMMANYKFLNNTVKVGRGNYIFTAEDQQAINNGTAPPEVIANFRRLSDAGKLTTITKDASIHAGDSGKQASKYHQLGPLADAKVDRDFLTALQNLNKITEHDAFVASLIELNSLWKMGKTIYAPGTTSVNFHSGTFSALMNGWFTYQNPAQTVRLMKQALDTAGTEVRPHGHKPEHRALANEMRGLGVIGDTDTSSELQASYERTRKGKVMSGIKKAAESTLPPDIVRALGGAHSFMVNVYQAGDDFWKAFGWLVETQMLKDSGMSEAQAKREAALRIRAVLPTYSEAHKIVQGIRDIPFFGNFPTFVSEVPRNVINTLQQTQMDWRTPGRRTIAIHRTVGTLAALGFMSLGAEMAKNAAGLDDDDERTLLNGVADWDRASSIAFQPVDRAKGIYTGVNLSRQSPHAVLVDPVVAAMRADSMTTGGVAAAAELLGPYTDEGGATKVFIDLVRNMDENGRKIVLDSDPIEEKFKKRAIHFMKAFEPGVSRDIRKAVADENPVKTAIERSSGLRKVKVDLPESLKFMAMDYLKAKREPYLDVRRAERAGNPEDYAEQVRQLKEADKQAFDRLHEMVAGMKKMGVKHELIVKALKDAGLTGTQQRNSVMNGNWREPKIQDNLRVDEPD